MPLTESAARVEERALRRRAGGRGRGPRPRPRRNGPACRRIRPRRGRQPAKPKGPPRAGNALHAGKADHAEDADHAHHTEHEHDADHPHPAHRPCPMSRFSGKLVASLRGSRPVLPARRRRAGPASAGAGHCREATTASGAPRPGPAAGEVAGGVDQPDVRERLREVADQPASLAGRTPRRAGRRRCAAPAAARRVSRASSVRPRRARLSASQKVQGRNAPSPGGRPSTLASAGVAGDERRRASAARSIASTVPEHARVGGRQEADQRDHQQAGVERPSSRRTGRTR